MQCRYVGDIGDFGKYGLLRSVCNYTNFKLGIVWYLVPDELHNNDGKHIDYLCDCCKPVIAAKLKALDGELYKKLQKIVAPECKPGNIIKHPSSGTRCIKKIREKGILPNAVFFEEPLSFHGIQRRTERIAHRETWLGKALKKIRECDIVFIDPDNGINSNNHAYRKKGPKYTFFNELKKFRSELLMSSEKRSLIIYHHSNFNETVDSQINTLLQSIREQMECSEPMALRYHRGASRTFFMVPGSKEASKSLSQRAEKFSGEWEEHFTLYKIK